MLRNAAVSHRCHRIHESVGLCFPESSQGWDDIHVRWRKLSAVSSCLYKPDLKLGTKESVNLFPEKDYTFLESSPADGSSL